MRTHIRRFKLSDNFIRSNIRNEKFLGDHLGILLLRGHMQEDLVSSTRKQQEAKNGIKLVDE